MKNTVVATELDNEHVVGWPCCELSQRSALKQTFGYSLGILASDYSRRK